MNINNSQIIVYTDNKFWQHIFPQLYNIQYWSITQLNTISDNIAKIYNKFFTNTNNICNTHSQQPLVSPDVDINLKYIDKILTNKIEKNTSKAEHEFMVSLEGYYSSLLEEHISEISQSRSNCSNE